MKEKDLGGKTLEGIDEVFSDIFNCVAFNGEKVMKEDELSEVLTVPEKLKHLVNDYKINVVNVAFMEREQIDKFKSDFRYVADYFWQIRNNKTYKPSNKKIKYAAQVLQMMSALTGDKRFEEAYNKVKKSGGGGSMCEYLDKIVGEGKRKGKLEGKREGMREERENGIKVLVESLSEVGIPGAVIAEKVIKKYDLTEEEAGKYIDRYSKIPA